MQEPNGDSAVYHYLEMVEMILESVHEGLIESNSKFNHSLVINPLLSSIHELKSTRKAMNLIIKQSQEPKSVCY